MDSRIADRRRVVKEEAARKRLRWTIGVLVVAGLVGAVVWAVQSPLLDLDEITISGDSRASVEQRLMDAGVASGMPLLSVDAGGIVMALESDPWILQAEARVVWPNALDIVVVEHLPRVWVKGSAGWMLVSERGYVVATSATGGTALPRIELADLSEVPLGQRLDSTAVLGAIEFVAALDAEVSFDGTEESLFAWVDGLRVRLGRPIDMSAKAASLRALLDHGVPPGSTIDLLSAVRPAVVPPVVEVDDSTDPEAEVEGEG
ncbi:MAG: FtsQ-type POTRA domain-containing protein [Acidimicrobiia bacterium]|nr:FtsQ-type POTRA domain-containing protein [Acidimicrobiia bacterium]NNF63685.1 FtsQ-type POTRA domain-containing protein [Acidimicrobiia bacterium]